MNIFVLNTGRCGSTTFIKACAHIDNYTSAHESRSGMIGEERMNYPPDHIEADNRLSWFLGRLDDRYGNNAFYVHLHRDRDKTAHSFATRHGRSIMRAYEHGILINTPRRLAALDLALDYYDTVTSNIRCFLKDKDLKMSIDLDTAQDQFALFWEKINATGDLAKAQAEFTKTYNASRSTLDKIMGRLFNK